MKNALVVLEKALEYNNSFIEYLKREISGCVGEIDTICFVQKGNDDIVSVLKELISRHRNLFVVTKESFSFTGKIISTICQDGLVVKNGMLVPLKAEKFVKNSYLIQKDSTLINVLKIDISQKLPKILISDRCECLSLFLFNEKKENELEANIKRLEMSYEKVLIIEGVVFYKIEGVHVSQIDSLKYVLNTTFSQYIMIGEDLSKIICQKLIDKGMTITAAESCTGGMLSDEIVKNSGVSNIFVGSVITYANFAKQKLVGVKEDTLKKYGAVSGECVKEMLSGVMKMFDADFSMAVSGVAGPTGGTKQKPVGTVYIGAKSRSKEIKIKRVQLKGDRTYIRKQSVLWALKLLVESDREFFFEKTKKTLDK